MFSKLYYDIIEWKDNLIYGKRDLPLIDVLVKYGWTRYKRRLNYDFKFSNIDDFSSSDEIFFYDLTIKGWRGDKCMYLVVSKTTFNKNSLSMNKREIFNNSVKDNCKVTNEKEGIDVLVKIDPFFKSYIRDRRLSSVLDK